MKIKKLIFPLIVAGLVTGPIYAGKNKNKTKTLPYGLQNKLQQGKPLPPGWQKKLSRGSVLDAQVYSHGVVVVPLDKNGLLTVRIEGKLIRLYEATREIAEILN